MPLNAHFTQRRLLRPRLIAVKKATVRHSHEFWQAQKGSFSEARDNFGMLSEIIRSPSVGCIAAFCGGQSDVRTQLPRGFFLRMKDESN